MQRLSLLELHAVEYLRLECLDVFSQELLQCLAVGLFNIEGALADIGDKFEDIFEVHDDVAFLVPGFHEVGDNLCLKLAIVEGILLLKEVLGLIQEQIELLTILLNHLILVTLINLNPLVLDISDQLLQATQILAQAQKLDQIFELISYWEHFLGQLLAYLDEDV